MLSSWQASQFGNSFYTQQVRVRGLSGRGSFLGQAAQDWYNRARAAVSTFDTLLARARNIAGKVERDAVFSWLGDPNVMESNWGQRNALDYNVREGQSQGVGVFYQPDHQSRTSRVEDIDREFADRIAAAERQSGVFQPGTSTTVVEMSPDYTVPILVGAGAVAIALAIF